MLNRLEFDLAMTTSSLHCLKVDSVVRRRLADCLVPPSKMKVLGISIHVPNGLNSIVTRIFFISSSLEGDVW
jgi:vacuolar fusion protein MON1